eukprot:11157662-Lingulodinium_polyedra.AAC.1
MPLFGRNALNLAPSVPLLADGQRGVAYAHDTLGDALVGRWDAGVALVAEALFYPRAANLA